MCYSGQVMGNGNESDPIECVRQNVDWCISWLPVGLLTDTYPQDTCYALANALVTCQLSAYFRTSLFRTFETCLSPSRTCQQLFHLALSELAVSDFRVQCHFVSWLNPMSMSSCYLDPISSNTFQTCFEWKQFCSVGAIIKSWQLMY